MKAPTSDQPNPPEDAVKPTEPKSRQPESPEAKIRETGGPKGPEPTRYGDWERKGRCVDF